MNARIIAMFESVLAVMTTAQLLELESRLLIDRVAAEEKKWPPIAEFDDALMRVRAEISRRKEQKN